MPTWRKPSAPLKRRSARTVSVRRRPVCGVDHLDGLEVGVELLGDDCCKAGVRTLTHLQLTGKDKHRSVGFDLDVRTNRIRQVFGRQWRKLRLRPRDKRPRMTTRCQSAGSSADSFFDARVRAAPAQISVHPHPDRRGIWCSVRLQQRDSRQRLARLTVAALDDVAAIPRVADCVDDGS
jgi:hypothetical protein